MTNEGAAVHGVGPGSTLGGRYVLSGRRHEHARYERWLAHDQTLQRDVVLLCFPVQSSTSAAALDAARRAAGIDEARLVRVLDVGRDGDTAFVVEEPLTRALDLVDLLDGGPLPASEARRLVGEAATALERARVRGLHHGVLGPHSLLRLDDGAVKVRGLAVEGALLGIDDVDGAQASRDDTVALVALAYAALTAHWPLATPGAPQGGLPPAPTAVGGIVSPSEIASGVPADLDTIARLTLGSSSAARGALSAAGDPQGPLTPGDLARQIAPWPSVIDPADVVRAAPATGVAPVPTDTSRDDAGPRLTKAGPSTRTQAGAVAAGAVAAGAAAASAGSRTVLGMPLGGGAGPAPDTDPDPDTDSLDLRGLAARSDAEPEADDNDDDGWWDELPVDAESSDAPAPGGRDPLRMTSHVRLSDTLEESSDELDPLLPMMGARTPSPSAGEHTGTALAALAALVVVAAVLGIFGVSRIGRSAAPTPATTTSAAATSTPTPTGSATATSSGPAAALTPVGIVQAQAWDPEGDNQEGNASAPRSFDGDPATMWRSQTYRSADFGGFAKSGIGLILDLGQQTTVKQVQVDLRGGADVTAYVATRESLEGATSIGSSTGVDGTVTFTAPAAGATGSLVILWFTKLAPDGEGGFRAQVAEARVSG